VGFSCDLCTNPVGSVASVYYLVDPMFDASKEPVE